MKNSNVHALLSELYRLLSDYVPADFLRASRYAGATPHLKEALQALALEAEASSIASPRQPLTQSGSISNSVPNVPLNKGQRTEKSDIVSLISQSPRFDSTRAILQFAKQVGLDVESRPKEGKERLANRVAEAILQTPDLRRSQIIAQLVRSGDEQTQGWIDVIKGARS